MLFDRDKGRISRILIVEDEPLVAFDNEHYLAGLGYHIVGAVDRAADAIALIAGEPIDLVIADVQLSAGGNGVDVARAASERGIPVLFAAGHCPIEARQFAWGCLSKPYGQRDLKGAVEAMAALAAGKSVRRPPRGLSLYR